ncbi:hypothetical protein, partial [Bacillus phage SPG24]
SCPETSGDAFNCYSRRATGRYPRKSKTQVFRS